MIDFIFKLIAFVYRVCFGLTVWIGLFLGHKIFIGLLKKFEMITEYPDVIYWVTFIGFIYFGYYLMRLSYDKDEETETRYETPKKRGNFSSLGNLDDRYGEAVDPKTYKGN